MSKSKNRKQVYDRWLLQKRSICVIYCHIGKVQKGNKKPHECGADGYLVIRPFHDIGCLIIVFNLAGAVRLISLKYIS